MNFRILLLLSTLFIQGLSAQTDIILHMHQKLGEQPFALDQTAMAPGEYAFQVTRMQYYISEIKLIHDGGQVTPVTDLYLLVSAEKDDQFDLGSFALENIEGIEFSIGVDEAHNHLDPALYSTHHPLALHNPSMHWGWAAGYRFIALEGKSSNNGGTSFPDDFQIHTIGDVNYETVTLAVQGFLNEGKLNIHIDANYTQTLKGINVQGGLYSHSETGASALLAFNMKTHVFLPSTEITGTVEPGVEGAFTVSPNPVDELVRLNYNFPGLEDLTFEVADISGRTIYRQELSGPSNTLQFEANWQPGLYIATVFSGGRRLAVEKIFVK